MRQPLGSRTHGILDYVTGASLVAASRVPPLKGRFAGTVAAATGANVLGLSAVTDYEVGALRLLPFKAHLAMDALTAIGLLGLPWITDQAKSGVDRILPLAVGAMELGAVLLTDPEGRGVTG
jgi:hypothetical protein